MSNSGHSSDNPGTPEGTRPKRRNRRTHSLYCLVIVSGNKAPFVIARLPEDNYPWRPLVAKLRRLLRADHGRDYDISEIEGYAGLPLPPRSRAAEWSAYNHKEMEEDSEQVPRLERAFAGDYEPFAKFHLYAWDKETEEFQLARTPAL